MNLKEWICPKLILCDVDAKDFQDALRQMAGHVIRKSEGGANKDLARFADQINALCDKWER
ncbi:hypothetical protein NE611_16715 [Anaerostipes caccae]|uniref:hypothetical protein n=1 Tax=Anaerostipes caccae TaxID=105841 RepID=UPI00210E09A9|nr:hypothetical protein [Anaerostipes caccae]MCQ4987183.1 hypothetical protein [Anaerostipes caccae]